MRILNSRILFLLVILFIVTPVGLAQQKRSPAKPVKKVAPPSAVSNPPTFDTLLGADSYKVYGEIRGVGQFIRSNSVNELLEPILKLAGPPKEFRALIKWLNVHADDVMTSRMLVGLWPTAKNIPDVLVAIEFASPEEAAKFEPQLNTFLPKLLPPEAPQVSEGGETKPTAPVAPKPSYYLKQSGSLILVTPTPLTIKNLKPAGSKMLSDDPSFRVARTRFTSEQVFVFLDVNAIEREEEESRKQAIAEVRKREAEAKKQEAEQQKEAEVNSASTFTLTESVKNPVTGEIQPSPMPQETSEPPTEKPAEPNPLADAAGIVVDSFFSAQGKWPEAIGFGVSFETDSFDVRALMIGLPGERVDPIPFFANLKPSPPIVPESTAILPADTELFLMVSLDLPQIYTAMTAPLKPVGNLPVVQDVGETKFASPFQTLEKQLKINIRDDLLPLLGSEVVISLPMKILDGGPLPKPPVTATTEDQKTPGNMPSFAIALSLKDKEGIKALLPKIVDSLGFKGASALAQTEKREDTELVSYANAFSYAFIENFLVLSSDAPTVRHIVDCYLKHETLASDTQYKNYTRWQPRQLQGQVYVSPALMESYKSWIDQPNSLMSDQTREILSRLTLIAQPVTYSLSNDGLGTLHELHIPKNLLLMAVTGISADSNPTPIIANERSAIGTMYLMAQAEVDYQTKKGAGTFGTLEQLIAEGFFTEQVLKDRGYRFEVTLLGNKFQITAVPDEYGKTGNRSYFVDQSLILRGGDHGGGMATVDDLPIN